MTEFIDTPDNTVGRREVPLTNEEIYESMKSRCALNHVTVMFRKGGCSESRQLSGLVLE